MKTTPLGSVPFEEALKSAALRVELALDAVLPTTEEGRIAEAMRYAAMSGGKRLRAFLTLEGAALFNVPPQQADRAAAAVECVHAYSLVHDDLPAMDDDDLRRGKPTVHRKWDEATAILAGDGLLTHAFEILAHPRTAQDPQVRLKLISKLAEASGSRGMVGGQDLDLAAEQAKQPLTLEAITELQQKKTGALILWAAEAGPVLGKSDSAPLMKYARNIGLAFQIQDDILDVTGNAETMGKAAGKDGDAGKATFVSHLGMQGAREMAAELVEEACETLAPYHAAAANLKACAHYIISRNK